MPFKIDLHTHSFFSGDGVSSPEENIAAAEAKGLHGFALTDHNTNDAVTYLLEKGSDARGRHAGGRFPHHPRRRGDDRGRPSSLHRRVAAEPI